MPEITTTVKAKSEYGIKTDEWGDEWANWSKPEYRGTPFNTQVQAGDRVQLTYAKADNGKVYISTIDKVITADVPFPPEDEFPPDDGLPFPPESSSIPPDATGSPGGATLDKDRLIVRQVCVKAACEALAMSPLDTEEKAGRITYLAGVLEDWVFRS